jgi:hypothetical protein
MANPLDHPVDDNLRIDVPGKLRAAAKQKRASGDTVTAKAMEDEARRVELKRQFARGTPGQRAVIKRMHARENAMDAHLLTAVVAGGLGLIGVIILVKKGRRK